MKTRIKVEGGKYYPQHKIFWSWFNFNGDVKQNVSVVFETIEEAKRYIDEQLEYDVHYIEYPEPVKMSQGGYQPKVPSTGYSVPPPPPKQE